MKAHTAEGIEPGILRLTDHFRQRCYYEQLCTSSPRRADLCAVLSSVLTRPSQDAEVDPCKSCIECSFYKRPSVSGRLSFNSFAAWPPFPFRNLRYLRFCVSHSCTGLVLMPRASADGSCGTVPSVVQMLRERLGELLRQHTRNLSQLSACFFYRSFARSLADFDSHSNSLVTCSRLAGELRILAIEFVEILKPLFAGAASAMFRAGYEIPRKREVGRRRSQR